MEKELMVNPEYRQQTKILKALAQPMRLQILEILHRGPTCVCDLVIHTGQRQPYISQHLIVLKEAGLVDFHSEGAKRYYRLNFKKIYEILAMLQRLG
jgi:ArsR family transcriptional regulator